MGVVNLVLTAPFNVDCREGIDYAVFLIPQFIGDLVSGGRCVRVIILPRGQARWLRNYIDLVSFLRRSGVRLIVPIDEINDVDDALRRRLIIIPHIDDSRLINRISELDSASIYANVTADFNEPPRLRELFIHLTPPKLRRGFNVVYGLPIVEADQVYLVHYP